MIPRIALVGLAAVLFSYGIAWLSSATGFDIGPGLTLSASLALLVVTWSYVRHTKALVDVEKEVLAAQHRQSHYAAISQLWGLILEAEGTLNRLELDLRDPLQPKMAEKERFIAVQTVQGHHQDLRAHASSIVRILVDVDGEMEEHALEMVNDMMSVAIDSARYTRLLQSELVAASKASRPFSIDNVIRSWEAPEDDHDRSDVRWADFTSGETIGKLDSTFTQIRMSCREEARQRGAAVS